MDTDIALGLSQGMQIDVPEQAIEEALAEITGRPTVFAIKDLGVWYGKSLALAGVTMDIRKNTVTAVIGPSGCGKSTFIRCLNRMSDAVPGIKVDGQIEYHGRDLRGARIDPVEVRRRIGMVFQRPNPFPKSIYDNIAFALADPRDEGRPGRSRRASAAARPRSGTRSRTA